MLPGHQLSGLLCAFSRSGTLFAIATPDGRVRSYDTVTGRLRSSASRQSKKTLGNGVGPELANGHLVERHLCIAWLESQVGKANSSESAGSWLAVGTAAGDVKAYDTATGELRWHAKGCSEGGVTCLAHSAVAGASLVASGADGSAAQLDARSGAERSRFTASKHAVSGAALSADGSKLLLGGSSLSLWDVAGAQRLYKLSGHVAPVRAIAFAPSGDRALSASPGERQVSVWNTSGTKKARRQGGVALTSLTTAAPVVQLSTCSDVASSSGGGGDAGSGDGFYAAAVTEDGEAYVWHVSGGGAAAAAAASCSGRLLARVRVGDGEPVPGAVGGGAECVLAAQLEAGSEGATLLVARSGSAKPVFERLPIPHTPPGSKAPVIALEPSSGGILIDGAGTRTARSAAAEAGPSAGEQAQQRQRHGAGAGGAVLGPENDGDAVRQRVASGSVAGTPGAAVAGAAPRKRGPPGAAGDGEAAAVAAAGAGNGHSPGAVAGGEEGEEGEEATLGARVAALEEAAASEQLQWQARQQGGAGASADGAAAAAAADAAGPLKADSLSVLLSQALRSGDRSLLERCLAVGSERVISNSVRRLVPVDAAALLRAAVERLQSRPARGQQLASWIRALLVSHTAYLMAAPSVQPIMSSLYQTIEARLAQQRTLLSLSGRLDLLLAQMPTAAADAAAADAADAADAAGTAGPRVVYEESASEGEEGDGVEVEDALAVGDVSDDYSDEDGEGGSGSGDGGSGGGSDDFMDEGEEEEEEEKRVR